MTNQEAREDQKAVVHMKTTTTAMSEEMHPVGSVKGSDLYTQPGKSTASHGVGAVKAASPES